MKSIFIFHNNFAIPAMPKFTVMIMFYCGILFFYKVNNLYVMGTY